MLSSLYVESTKEPPELAPYLLPEHALPDDVAEDAAIAKPLGWRRERLITLKIMRRAKAIRKAREAWQKDTGEKVIIQPTAVA